LHVIFVKALSDELFEKLRIVVLKIYHLKTFLSDSFFNYHWLCQNLWKFVNNILNYMIINLNALLLFQYLSIVLGVNTQND
jgi:hypothetical protein